MDSTFDGITDLDAGMVNVPFDKGRILPFDEAIVSKLDEIRCDMATGDGDNILFSFMQDDVPAGSVNLLNGSCLDVLPKLESGV